MASRAGEIAPGENEPDDVQTGHCEPDRAREVEKTKKVKVRVSKHRKAQPNHESD